MSCPQVVLQCVLVSIEPTSDTAGTTNATIAEKVGATELALLGQSPLMKATTDNGKIHAKVMN